MGARIGIPQVLDHLGPAGHLLDLVEYEECAAPAGVCSETPCGSPLLFNPLRVTQCRLVGAGVAGRQSGSSRGVLDERRLADLAGACDYLDETARFQETVDQFAKLGPGVGDRITQAGEYYYSACAELQSRYGVAQANSRASRVRLLRSIVTSMSIVNCRGVPAGTTTRPSGAKSAVRRGWTPRVS